MSKSKKLGPDENIVVSNVPIPETRLKYPFHQMKVGDSFYTLSGAVRSAAFNHANTHDKKFITRAEGEGFRVWRVK